MAQHPAHPSQQATPFPRAFYALAALLITLALLFRTRLTTSRWFCVDEIEHLHSAWSISQGLTPYRDFFEMHTPLFYYFLAPLFALIHPEQSYDRAILGILAARWVMFALNLLLLFLIYRLGRSLHSRAAGVLAVLFALSTMMFVDRTTEVRPDMLSVPAMLAALILSHRAFRATVGVPPSGGKTNNLLHRPTLLLFLSGLLWALAYLATPKILFALLGFCPAAFLILVDPLQRRPIREQARLGFSLLGGFLLPVSLAAAYFAAIGALHPFFEQSLFINLRWIYRMNPWDAAGELAYENPTLTAFGLAGTLAAFAHSLTPSPARRLLLIPAATCIALVAGIFLMPVPHTEYFMMPITLLAIFQATLLLDITSLIKRAFTTARRRTASFLYAPSRRTRIIFPAACLAGAGLCWILTNLKPPFAATSSEFAAWALALAAITLTLALRQRHAALMLLLAMLTLFPLRRFPTLFAPTNDSQRTMLAFVHTHTAPTDPVLDGWQFTIAPFRPNAWFYWYLPFDLRMMITPDQFADLHRGLTDGTISPQLIVFDEDTAALPPDIVATLRTRYAPTANPTFWAPRPPNLAAD